MRPTAIAFEGGGVRILCMQGVVEALEKHGMRNHIKRVIGTSAGALAALVFALGSTSQTMKETMEKLDFTMLTKDDNMVRDIERLCTEWGAHNGTRLRRMAMTLLEKLGMSSKMTLLEVERVRGIELVITTTHLESRKTVYLTAKTHPNLPAAVAVRMSMSIPLYFTPFVAGPHEEADWGVEKGTYVDGGLLDDLPIAYFDPASTLLCTIETDGGREPIDTDIDSLATFSQRVADVAWSGVGRVSLGPTAPWVVCVPVSDVGMTEFDLSATKRRMLMKRGLDRAERVLSRGTETTRSSWLGLWLGLW